MPLLEIPWIGAAMLLRTFIIQPYTIVASSMLPALEVGDYVVASKFEYGYSRYSLPVGNFLPAFTIFKTAPKRGDVVFFQVPGKESTTYVKRVIGLAGDRVQVKHGVVYLNGTPLLRERTEDYQQTAHATASKYRETMPDGRSFEIMELVDDSDGDNTEVFEVPPGHCFVLGDNRDNSLDSRFNVGYVPYANIVAKALVTIDFSGKSLKAHTLE